MQLSESIPIIEAVVYSALTPVNELTITHRVNTVIGNKEWELCTDQVLAALEGINEKYDAEFYPFEVIRNKAGWAFQLKENFKKALANANFKY